MSVGAVVTYRKAEPKTHYLPLATEDEFRCAWLPVAEAQGLQWIALFASGALVSGNDVPEVLRELAQMQEAIASVALGPEIRAQMQARLDALRGLLDGLDLNDVEEIFIG